jgi:hypothetical protein
MESVSFPAPSPSRPRQLSSLDINAQPGSRSTESKRPSEEPIDLDAEVLEEDDKPALHGKHTEYALTTV